ncbi:dihydrolipoamide acetyltransferase family protein [Solicola sp. PLA-1-18]|uniref:dihydrolipoamide acetyltransferase family protein n=1 Tax=Solicola sp. PLA-1-18 TaxID=3380532 RepID=UPI003B81666B
MANVLRVPEVAAGATEAVLSEWLVAEGSAFEVGDPVVMIETDKALVEVEAEQAAVLLRVMVAGGSSVEVGAPMALVGDASERDADLDALLRDLGVGPTETSDAPERREAPDPDHEAPGVVETGAEAESPAPAEATTPDVAAEPVTASEESVAGRNGRVFVSPIARRMLKQAGLTVDGIDGTGPHGRMVRRDVEQAIAAHRSRPAEQEAPSPAAAVPAPASEDVPAPQADVPEGVEVVPHTRLRKAVARRLTESKQTVPHFYLRRSARLDDLLALRAQVNEVAPTRVSVNDLLIRAAGLALRQVPDANVVWTDDALHRFATADVAVAVASSRGLMTPVLTGVEGRSVSGIATEVKRLVEGANEGTLRQSQLEGGSMAISNLGMYGVEEFDAIINPPHSMILAVGAARPQPVVDDGAPAVATVVNLSLSVDHRAVDGALAATWLGALVELLEQPMRLLA